MTTIDDGRGRYNYTHRKMTGEMTENYNYYYEEERARIPTCVPLLCGGGANQYAVSAK